MAVPQNVSRQFELSDRTCRSSTLKFGPDLARNEKTQRIVETGHYLSADVDASGTKDLVSCST